MKLALVNTEKFTMVVQTGAEFLPRDVCIGLTWSSEKGSTTARGYTASLSWGAGRMERQNNQRAEAAPGKE